MATMAELELNWIMNKMPPSDDRYLEIMSLENVEKARRFHQSFPQYGVTAMADLKKMAEYLGLGGIYVKDERWRFGLNAFKVLGASFAMVYGDSEVTAGISRDVNAGSLTVNAASDHADNTASVSGTDALSGELNTEAMKQVSADASAALDILDNRVNAVLTGAAVTQGDLKLTAGEDAVSETRASGYAAGSQTAVGGPERERSPGKRVTRGMDCRFSHKMNGRA